MSGSRQQRKSVDVQETPDTYLVQMRLEGVDPAGLNVSGFGNTVTVAGDLRDEWQEEDDGGRWILRAQHFGSFERSLTLATAVAVDAATTSYEDDVMTITLPKIDRSEVQSLVGGQGQQDADPAETAAIQGAESVALAGRS
ncbi:MAG: hypothetical protein QOF01_186 [Thermomicrobiales bacterium]|jgi:HSP20 family protein|nr:hypothetical protein [Thermomicrobiales bacterium]MEA2525782.1 hypothetical protein [Thermomicrobiales bacterium]MEA2593717.1 hypothetical protein [Thermomicrobiales bacterium]